MNGYNSPVTHRSEYGRYREEPEEEGSGSWAGIAIAGVIILIIIGALVYYYFFYNPPPPNPGPTPPGGSNTAFQWTFRDGTSQTADTWTAGAGQAYRVNTTATGTFTLTLNAPAEAVGQQFLIINQSAASIRVIAPGTTYTVNPRSNSSAVWMSQTVVNELYRG